MLKISNSGQSKDRWCILGNSVQSGMCEKISFAWAKLWAICILK